MADTTPNITHIHCENCEKEVAVHSFDWAVCEGCEMELCTDCGRFDDDGVCVSCRLKQI